MNQVQSGYICSFLLISPFMVFTFFQVFGDYYELQESEKIATFMKMSQLKITIFTWIYKNVSKTSNSRRWWIETVPNLDFETAANEVLSIIANGEISKIL